MVNLPMLTLNPFPPSSQDEEDPRHTLGCSPERYPTQKFIEDFSGWRVPISSLFYLS
jgi:hypothetical protein